MRDKTEHPEAFTNGTNALTGTDASNIKPALDRFFAGKWKKAGIPPLWNGKAAEKIVKKLTDIYK